MTDLQKILELIEAKDKADGCDGCAFEHAEEWEMPCCKCKRGCRDYWRKKTESEGEE